LACVAALAFVISQFIMVSSGTLYLFPVYSGVMKTNLGLTQEESNFVGSAAHFGAFFSVFGGMFFDALGARATLMLGGSLKLVGYLMMAGCIEGHLPQNYLFAGLCGYIFGTGCSTSLTAALGANYATFKDHSMHGRLVGLLTAFFGLSSGCLSLVYDVFFTSPVSFIYFIAFFAGGIDICAAFFVGHPKNLALPHTPDSPVHNNIKGPGVHGVGVKQAYPLGRGGGGLGAPVLSVVSGIGGIFGAADTDTKFSRGLAACAVAAVHVALSGAVLHVAGGSVPMAAGCLMVLAVLVAAQVRHSLTPHACLTHSLTHARTHSLTHSRTHSLTHSLTPDALAGDGAAVRHGGTGVPPPRDGGGAGCGAQRTFTTC
jgi:MFS family permease